VGDGEDGVLVLLYGSGVSSGRVEAWMLGLDGTLMDRLDTHSSTHDGTVVARFAEGGGLTIFRAATRAEAERFVAEDPFVLHGTHRAELRTWNPWLTPDRSQPEGLLC
jgi:hypothetical protein